MEGSLPPAFIYTYGIFIKDIKILQHYTKSRTLFFLNVHGCFESYIPLLRIREGTSLSGGEIRFYNKLWAKYKCVLLKF